MHFLSLNNSSDFFSFCMIMFKRMDTSTVVSMDFLYRERFLSFVPGTLKHSNRARANYSVYYATFNKTESVYGNVRNPIQLRLVAIWVRYIYRFKNRTPTATAMWILSCFNNGDKKKWNEYFNRCWVPDACVYVRACACACTCVRACVFLSLWGGGGVCVFKRNNMRKNQEWIDLFSSAMILILYAGAW